MNKLLAGITGGAKLKELFEAIITLVVVNLLGQGMASQTFGDTLNLITNIGSAIIVLSFVAKIIPDRFKYLKLLLGGIGYMVLWPFDFVLSIIFFPFKALRNIRIKNFFTYMSKYNSLGRMQRMVEDENYTEELKHSFESTISVFDTTSNSRGEKIMFKKLISAISANKVSIMGILGAIALGAGEAVGGAEVLEIPVAGEYAIYGVVAAVVIAAVSGKGFEKVSTVQERKEILVETKLAVKSAKDANKARAKAVAATKAKLESNLVILREKLIEAELNVELGLPNQIDPNSLNSKIKLMEDKLAKL